MTDIRNSLNSLADALDSLQSRPAPKAEINDRELSGNKINGGVITNFCSVGIQDLARGQVVLRVTNDGISAKAVETPVIPNPLTVKGDLTVEGEVHATKLHVEEVSADVRYERTSPLEFKGENGPAVGKGLIWTGGSYTKQLILQGKPERFWSSEDFDLNSGKEYRIANQTVISADSLGTGIVNSNLRRVGTLERLQVNGPFNVDEFFKYDAESEQISIGGGEPNGMLSIDNWDHQFVIDPTEDRQWKIGTYTTTGLKLTTDDTTRIAISSTGQVTVYNKTNFKDKVGIGVNNFTEDADLTVAGPIRFQDKKMEVGERAPASGSYVKGDIVWNDNPRPTSYVGWVCVREGTPGEWKPFGPIAS